MQGMKKVKLKADLLTRLKEDIVLEVKCSYSTFTIDILVNDQDTIQRIKEECVP